MTRFSKILKNLMEEKNINQVELAKRTGITQSSISDYLRGKYVPKQDKLGSLAFELGVTVDYLIGDSVFRTAAELYQPWSKTPYGHKKLFTIGELLKENRLSKNISITEMSKALGVTELDIEKFENGTLPMPREWAQKYAAVFDAEIVEMSVDESEIGEYVFEDPDEDLIQDQNIITEYKFPSHFNKASEARRYLSMHTIFGSDGFNNSDIDKMTDEEVLEYANDVLKIMESLSSKYKK